MRSVFIRMFRSFSLLCCYRFTSSFLPRSSINLCTVLHYAMLCYILAWNSRRTRAPVPMAAILVWFGVKSSICCMLYCLLGIRHSDIQHTKPTDMYISLCGAKHLSCFVRVVWFFGGRVKSSLNQHSSGIGGVSLYNTTIIDIVFKIRRVSIRRLWMWIDI